jgi:hypothetical protein
MRNRTSQQGRSKTPLHFARAAFLALFTACQACQCSPAGEPTCRVKLRTPVVFPVAGEPSTVTLGLLQVCPNSDAHRTTAADQVTVEVFDPDDQPVPFTVSEIIRSLRESSVVDTSVEVSFTPHRAGGWRITANFEPGIGRMSEVVQAIERHGDAGMRVLAVEFPPDCVEYSITDQGTALCATRGPHGAFDLATGRGQRIPGSQFVVEPNAVWSVRHVPPMVERWVDDGNALKLSHTLKLATSVRAISPGAGGLWMLGEPFADSASVPLFRVEPQLDGGLLLQERGSVSSDNQEVLGGDPLSLYGPRSVVTLLADGGSRMVSVPLGAFAGTDQSTLWVNNGDVLVAIRPLVGGTLQESVDIAANRLPGRPLISPTTPVIISVDGTQAAVARFDGTEIRLELYDPGPDYAPVSTANSKHAFARSLDGKLLKVFDR